MVKLAYKKKYDFGDHEKYRLFLKEHLLKLSPRYYGVCACRRIDTSDGLMYAIKIVQDLENPHFEPIVEAWINDEFVYLWRDHCWAIAVDKNGKRIIKSALFPTACLDLNLPMHHKDQALIPDMADKFIVIHRIGTETIE
jgi:hypothetical protein